MRKSSSVAKTAQITALILASGQRGARNEGSQQGDLGQWLLFTESVKGGAWVGQSKCRSRCFTSPGSPWPEGPPKFGIIIITSQRRAWSHREKLSLWSRMHTRAHLAPSPETCAVPEVRASGQVCVGSRDGLEPLCPSLSLYSLFALFSND